MSAFARETAAASGSSQALIQPGAAPLRPASRRPVPERDRAGEIHATAVVHPSAQIDPTARVGPYVIVGPNVRVGPGTRLEAHAVVHADTTLGADNRVCSFAVVGHDPQDLKYRGEATTLVIGDRNVIREHATLHRGTGVGGGVTRIGSDNLIMVGAHVAHDCILEDHVILANGVMLGGHVHVQSGATLAGAAAVHHFATIGRLSFVGGLARISKDVPPYLVVEGHPAEPRKINSVALTRRGWSEADIENLRAAFKALFRPRTGRKSRAAGADAEFAAGDEQTPDNAAQRDAGAASVQSVILRLRADSATTQAALELCDFLERMAAGVHGRWRETLRERRAAPAPGAPASAPASAPER